MKNRLAIVVNGIILVAALAMTACSEESDLPEAKTHRVSVNYIAPENSEYLYIYTLLKEGRALHAREIAEISQSLPASLDIGNPVSRVCRRGRCHVLG